MIGSDAMEAYSGNLLSRRSSAMMSPDRSQDKANSEPSACHSCCDTGVLHPPLEGDSARCTGSDDSSHARPTRRRLLAGMQRAAFLAGARLLIVEERLIERRQVANEMLDLHLDAVHQRAAFETV